VFIGDTIHVTKRVIEAVVKTADAGLVAFDTRVLNQRGEVVLAYVDRLLVKRRAGDSSAVAKREPVVA
jgi:acyl dehydratase